MSFREITIEPGSGTGLQCYHGQLVVVVEEGELAHYADIYPGGVHVYRAGDSVIEGARYVHEGINEGSENLVLMVTYITPEGKPLAETDLTQCDRLRLDQHAGLSSAFTYPPVSWSKAYRREIWVGRGVSVT